MKLLIKEMFLDETIELLKLISSTYDRRKHSHSLFIKKGAIGLTDTYKGKKGDMHQVFRDIELEVRDEEVYPNVKKILVKFGVQYKEVK